MMKQTVNLDKPTPDLNAKPERSEMGDRPLAPGIKIIF